MFDHQDGTAPAAKTQYANGAPCTAASAPATAVISGRASSETPTANNKPKPVAIISACCTSAAASSRRLPPSARATAETTPPPIAPVDIIAISSTNGSITAQPASVAVPWRAASQVSVSWAITCSIDSAVVGAASAKIWRSSALLLGRAAVVAMAAWAAAAPAVSRVFSEGRVMVVSMMAQARDGACRTADESVGGAQAMMCA